MTLSIEAVMSTLTVAVLPRSELISERYGGLRRSIKTKSVTMSVHGIA